MNEIIQINYALDTLYILIFSAFVMWMAAGFAMLEAGLVRSKNVVEMLTKNIALFSIACIMFYFVGYSLMYPDGGNGFLPNFNILLPDEYTTTQVLNSKGEIVYSKMADFMFQVVFVATAISVVSGVVAERMKLFVFIIFSGIFAGFIYPLTGYWKWGGGFLDKLGFVDFAGSGVVHLAGASAGLAAVILLKARLGKYSKNGKSRALVGSNMPLAFLGTFILWFGWFGFNGGSLLKASDIESANGIAMIFVNTNLSACAGALGALFLSKIWFDKADLTMSLNGALGGLVAITAEPLSPTPLMAIGIGFVAGLLVVVSIVWIDNKLKLDDPVGALGVHGVCGIFGLLMTAITVTKATLMAQLIGIVSIFSATFIITFILWYILKKTIGIRASKEEEIDGLDISECGLEAYPEFSHK